MKWLHPTLVAALSLSALPALAPTAAVGGRNISDSTFVASVSKSF